MHLKASTTYRICFFFIACCWVQFSGAQTTFWTEGFGNGCNRADTANQAVTTNGAWSVSNTGTNGSHANDWYISSTSAISTSANNCDENCNNMPANTNKTLHISNVDVSAGPPFNVNFGADSGGVFLPGGYTAAGINVATAKRVESPTINCTGYSSITLQFDYFEGGADPNQSGTIEYFDGTSWSALPDPPKTPAATCSPLGEWSSMSPVNLPASADNNPNVKIAFTWVNDDTSPTPASPEASYSVDNIQLSGTAAPPPSTPFADFTVTTSTTICAGDTVEFADLSTNKDSIQWTFISGTPANSTDSTVSVTYPNPGTYDVRIQAFDTAAGTSDDSLATALIVVNQCGAVDADFSALSGTTICNGDTIEFRDNSTNSDSVYWTFPGGNPANSSDTAVTVVYSNPGTYDVTLEAFNSTGTDDTTATGLVVVQSCSNAPVAGFTASERVVCAGDTIDFIDTSQYSPAKWSWFFPEGSNTEFDTTQNPQVVYNEPGTYEVTLIVENAAGQDHVTKTDFITVNACPDPVANFSIRQDTVCVRDQVTFVDSSLHADSVAWFFPGAHAVSMANPERPVARYDTAGVYFVGMIAMNDFGIDTFFVDSAVTALPYPEVEAGADQTVLYKEQTTLVADGTTEHFYWEPRGLLSCYICKSPQTALEDTTTFYVINYYDNEAICPSMDSLTINVEKEFFAGVPDIFSPNRDNENDNLFVIGNGIFRSDLKVYNRHGTLVYRYTESEPAWDGTYKDKPVAPGVYSYVANVVFDDGTTKFMKGTVTLVR